MEFQARGIRGQKGHDMNGQELFLSDHRSAGVFYCSKCRTIHRELESANECCSIRKCKECGSELESNSYCRPCFERGELEKEEKRFAAAEKLTEWDGWVYSEGHGNNGFAETIEDLFDGLEEGDDIPEYVWTCDPNHFVCVSLGDITQRIAEDGDAYEDFSADDLHGLEALKLALDALTKQTPHLFLITRTTNGRCLWTENRSKK